MPYLDFIPEGQDLGGQGDGGFKDFVPSPKAVPVSTKPELVVEVPQQEVVAEKPVPAKKGGKR